MWGHLKLQLCGLQRIPGLWTLLWAEERRHQRFLWLLRRGGPFRASPQEQGAALFQLMSSSQVSLGKKKHLWDKREFCGTKGNFAAPSEPSVCCNPSPWQQLVAQLCCQTVSVLSLPSAGCKHICPKGWQLEENTSVKYLGLGRCLGQAVKGTGGQVWPLCAQPRDGAALCLCWHISCSPQWEEGNVHVNSSDFLSCSQPPSGHEKNDSKYSSASPCAPPEWMEGKE